jgi:hypothetical protein
MDEFISIMMDVARLVTGGSDLARTEARRIDAERERRAEEMAHGPALHPTAILAVGNTEPPVERLRGLQSAFAKVVQFAVAVGQARPRLTRIGLLRFRLR